MAALTPENLDASKRASELWQWARDRSKHAASIFTAVLLAQRVTLMMVEGVDMATAKVLAEAEMAAEGWFS